MVTLPRSVTFSLSMSGDLWDIFSFNLSHIINFKESQASMFLSPFSSICTALRAWLFSSASELVVARLRKNLFSHLLTQVTLLSSIMGLS